ncbi:MAG: hypothetical protein DKINENOH_00855 [bacterium]|nr:hypothetical protein [bacterium]
MKPANHPARCVARAILLGALAFLACGGSQADFEKTKKLNTIAAYNKFIEKYPKDLLTTEAINLRDQLAFTMVSDSASVDSLAPLRVNALENLFANAEQAWRHAESDKKRSQATKEFARAAKLYEFAARIQNVVGKDSTESYKRAAYAYYKAARQLDAEQLLYLKLARALIE